jgi:phenylalanyl-tRNA synthetase alpha chain
MDLKRLARALSPTEKKIIPYLKEGNISNIIRDSKLEFVEVMRALQLLENKEILKVNTESKELVKLGENGIKYAQEGLPEMRFLKAVKDSALTLNQIKEKANLTQEEATISIGALKSKVAIDIEKGKEMKFKIASNGNNLLSKQTPEEKLIEKISKEQIEKSDLKDVELFAYNNLSKRKGIIKTEEEKIRTIKIKHDLSKIKIEKTEEKLTREMLKTGSWKNKKFREYDIHTNVPKIQGGRRHPYNEAVDLIRNVFIEMGFKEMQGPWVETAFWGMDSMWIAQDHPMREVQDTFYLNKSGDLPENKIVQGVKAAQENGAKTGSKGHGGIWDPETAAKLILRQHSTATTYRKFGIDKVKDDCKYFEIAKVFRNETTDATHLPEFDQAEGFIMGDDLTLADLMGFIKEFYKKLGITKIRFKPTFNPYTEPSMEAHYYDEKMGGWFALINSGIFRPESLAPYGITKRVIAWGMGVTRIAAILNKKKHLKELLGPETSLEWINTHKRIKW